MRVNGMGAVRRHGCAFAPQEGSKGLGIFVLIFLSASTALVAMSACDLFDNWEDGRCATNGTKYCDCRNVINSCTGEFSGNDESAEEDDWGIDESYYCNMLNEPDGYEAECFREAAAAYRDCLEYFEDDCDDTRFSECRDDFKKTLKKFCAVDGQDPDDDAGSSDDDTVAPAKSGSSAAAFDHGTI